MVLLEFIPETTMSSSSRTSLLGFKLTSCFTVVLLICLETVLLSTVSNCAKTFYVHWNTSNSIFRIDNTDHIIDVNKGNLKFEYDQVNIICPVYSPGSSQEEDAEKYIIYNVSKEEYDTCRITNPNPRIIAICDKPHKLMYFTITFRPFTPQPGGLEFLAGYDYYFISTSSKEDLHRRIGGRCSSHNMKIVFKVCCSSDENNSGISGNVIKHTNTSDISKTPQHSITTMDVPIHSTSSINWPPSWTSTESSLLPSTQKTTETSVNVKIKPKKTNEYEKHPNDVVKNEELTYNNSGDNVVPVVSVVCFLGSVVLVINKVR